MNKKRVPTDLRKYLIENNWVETDNGFEADNLLIYFRGDFKEWRLKDVNVLSNMDIMSINIPFDENEKLILKKQCSIHHKS